MWLKLLCEKKPWFSLCGLSLRTLCNWPFCLLFSCLLYRYVTIFLLSNSVKQCVQSLLLADVTYTFFQTKKNFSNLCSAYPAHLLHQTLLRLPSDILKHAPATVPPCTFNCQTCLQPRQTSTPSPHVFVLALCTTLHTQRPSQFSYWGCHVLPCCCLLVFEITPCLLSVFNWLHVLQIAPPSRKRTTYLIRCFTFPLSVCISLASHFALFALFMSAPSVDHSSAVSLPSVLNLILSFIYFFALSCYVCFTCLTTSCFSSPTYSSVLRNAVYHYFHSCARGPLTDAQCNSPLPWPRTTPRLCVRIVSGNTAFFLTLSAQTSHRLTFAWHFHLAGTKPYSPYLGSHSWSKHSCTTPFSMAEYLLGAPSSDRAFSRRCASDVPRIFHLQLQKLCLPVLLDDALCLPNHSLALFFHRASLSVYALFTVTRLLLMTADVSWNLQSYSLVGHMRTASGTHFLPFNIANINHFHRIHVHLSFVVHHRRCSCSLYSCHPTQSFQIFSSDQMIDIFLASTGQVALKFLYLLFAALIVSYRDQSMPNYFNCSLGELPGPKYAFPLASLVTVNFQT